MKRISVILTIAGSDSGGGAGIEADIKTIACLGLHPACAVTSVTAQNTTGVLDACDIPGEFICKQIDAVCGDMKIKWAKSGMLSSAEITSAVASMVKKYGLKLVVDPVMAAEAGGDLLCKDAVSTLKEELLPVSEVVTPNINEASILSGIQINDVESAKEAAKIISMNGVRFVIVTGGHLDASDIIYDAEKDTYTIIPGTFIKGGTHGSGCTYSAALASFLAQGYGIEEAAKGAKGFVVEAIKGSVPVGKGAGPVNQLSGILHNSERYKVLENVKEGVRILTDCRDFAALTPEVGCNIAMAVKGAESIRDVAAVTGRIVRVKGKVVAVGDIDFDASSHVARIVLTAMEHDASCRAAVNIMYCESVLEICRELGLDIASFSREEEPQGVHTMDWGTSEAIKTHGRVPDIIYDIGGFGKEAMIRVTGHDAKEVANLAVRIARRHAGLQRQ
ncbi:MAG: bifunctional hydroxymethylpyrimidine kinase/phosphomethylpyrimidine kinase [Methanolobus sp.]|nr:bifunctional hydroxymethylpyrimidine kinase/phosphomethylpyrimidine kinase [Methanolobus sp.]